MLLKHKPLHKLTNAELAVKLNEVAQYSVLSDLAQQVLAQAVTRFERGELGHEGIAVVPTDASPPSQAPEKESTYYRKLLDFTVESGWPGCETTNQHLTHLWGCMEEYNANRPWPSGIANAKQIHGEITILFNSIGLARRLENYNGKLYVGHGPERPCPPGSPVDGDWIFTLTRKPGVESGLDFYSWLQPSKDLV